MLRVVNIHKSFGAIEVLKGISFSVGKGEIVALMGENGAGKTTLMNVISGIHHRDEGDVFLDDEKVSFDLPKQAEQAGIIKVHQELSLVPELSISENILNL